MADEFLDGRIAIVSGGGGGMGGAMTLGLAASGARVVAVDLNAEGLDGLVAEAEKSQLAARVLPMAADVTDVDQCRIVVERTRAAFGGVDVLVNNAGIGMQTIRETYMNEPVRFWEAEPERWQAMMDVNFKGPFLMAREAVPHMIAAGWGRIVCISSVAARMGWRGGASYAAAKGALLGLVHTLALETASKGITVNAVLPG